MLMMMRGPFCFFNYLLLCVVILYPRFANSFLSPDVPRHDATGNNHIFQNAAMHHDIPWSSRLLLQMNKGSGDQEQAMEALHSLGDFHPGKWEGKATSFSLIFPVY